MFVGVSYSYGGGGGLVVNASDSGSRGRGSSPTRVKPCCVLEQGTFTPKPCCVLEQGTFTPKKVLVIPRKRWLRPNMDEQLFSGTLRISQPTKIILIRPCNLYHLASHFYKVKLEFTGYTVFLFCAFKHRLRVLVKTSFAIWSCM